MVSNQYLYALTRYLLLQLEVATFLKKEKKKKKKKQEWKKRKESYFESLTT